LITFASGGKNDASEAEKHLPSATFLEHQVLILEVEMSNAHQIDKLNTLMEI
jgi:hypothetical protein